jgi:GTP-binding protein Era
MNKFGHVCFVGRPNVGKSTLTNRLLNLPLAIESAKPQTTWYAVAGLVKTKKAQFVLTDTPGIHQFIHRAQNQTMNRIAYSAISQADVICHLVTPRWNQEDEHILQFLQGIQKPKILIINKIDQTTPHELLPYIAGLKDKPYGHIVPLSAKTGLNVDLLTENIVSHLQKREYIGKQNIHNHSEAFLAQEMLREQLMVQLQSEMPYTTFIEVFHTKQHEKALEINVNLHVKHIGQKKIIIGKDGEQIKKIGQFARKRLQVILKKRIILKAWVKISPEKTGHIYLEQ